MDKRRKNVDPATERALREEFFSMIENGQMSIAEAVQRMRRISRLTQPEFAKHRGISVGALKQLEAGEGNPKVETLNKVAKIFGLEVGFVRKQRRS